MILIFIYSNFFSSLRMVSKWYFLIQSFRYILLKLTIGFAGVWLVVIVKSLPGAKYLRTFWAWIGKRIGEMSTFYMSLEVISSLGCLKTESAIIRSVTRWEDISVQIFRCANLTLNTNINIQFFFIAYNNLHKSVLEVNVII